MALAPGTSLRPQPKKKKTAPKPKPITSVGDFRLHEEQAKQAPVVKPRAPKPSPGRVVPDTITHQDRKKIKRVQHLDRLAHATIYGGIPTADISREMKAMSPHELVHFSLTVKQMSKQAQREREEGIHAIPAALGFGELTKPLFNMGKPDPLWGSLEALSIFPFFRTGRAAKEGIEASLKLLPEGEEALGAIKGVAPLREGHVRLYRGEGKATEVDPDSLDFYGEGYGKGGWFTDTLPVAEEYARRNKGRVYTIDLPEDVARPWSRQRIDDNGRKWTEYRFPTDLVDVSGKKPLDVPSPDLIERVVGSLGSAKKLQREQEAIRHVERGERAGAAALAAEKAGGGEAGHRAARGALKGEYTKLPFTRLAKELGTADPEMRRMLQPQVDETIRFIRAHPSFRNREFDIQNTEDAFLKVINGELPTKSEIKLLENVFGEEVATYFKWLHTKNLSLDALNLPRSLRSTADLSAPFRQALVLGNRHKILATKAWGPMLKSLVSEKAYTAKLAEIHARPTYGEMMEGGVKFTELGLLGVREEAFMSNLAEKIPLAGKLVRASGRAFTVFLDTLRADVFDLLLEHAEKSTSGIFHRGNALETLSAGERAKVLKGIASIVNVGTGRGGLGFQALEKAAPLLNGFLFSPRLIASRVALLNPVYYAKLHPFARKEAVRAMLELVGTGAAVLWLMKQAGAEVGLDPRSSDFGKIKFGDFRLDIWGGLQQYVVNGYRIAVKESVSSTTGEVKTAEGGFGEQSQWSIFEDFALGKLAPTPGYVVGKMKGRKPSGEEFDEAKEGARLFLPLGWENAYEGFTAPGGGMAAGVASATLGNIGFGTQTYGPTPSYGRASTGGAKPGRNGRKPGGRKLAPKPGSNKP